MEYIKNEFLKTIFSFFMGGLVTYIPSLLIEKRKKKKEFNLKALETTLIPLAQKIEDLQSRLSENNMLRKDEKNFLMTFII